MQRSGPPRGTRWGPVACRPEVGHRAGRGGHRHGSRGRRRRTPASSFSSSEPGPGSCPGGAQVDRTQGVSENPLSSPKRIQVRSRWAPFWGVASSRAPRSRSARWSHSTARRAGFWRVQLRTSRAANQALRCCLPHGQWQARERRPMQPAVDWPATIPLPAQWKNTCAPRALRQDRNQRTTRNASAARPTTI